MNIYSIPPLFVSIFTITVGLLVLIRGRKLIYALTTFSVFVWLLGYAVVYSTQNYERALFLVRILYIGVIFIPAFSYHFAITFLNLKGHQRILQFNYFVSFIFALSTQSNSFILGLYKYYWGYQTKVGFLHSLFLIYFAIIMNRAVILLYAHYRQKKKESLFLEATRIRYVLISFFVSIFAAADFLPNYGFQFYPLGFLCIAFHATATTYAILKYRLMDINVALTRAGIFAVVYALVLGIPFWLGYRYELWLYSTWIMLFLATLGPFTYQYLRGRAEDIILRDQHRYQQALRELSRVMTRIRDLDELTKAIVSTIVNRVKVSFASVYLKEDVYEGYQLSHIYPADSKAHFLDSVDSDSEFIKVIYEQKRPLLNEEIVSRDKLNLDASLVIPCFMEEELLGFMCIGSKPNNQMFTPDDMLVFETLSYSTSLAIENCRFWKEIEDRQRKARLQEMDTYSYSLAHEIDNPMYIIMGEAGLVKKEFLRQFPEETKRKEAEESLDYIIEAAKRVSGMVKAIRDFGSPTTGELIPLKIEDVINSFAQLYSPQFKANGVTFEKELGEGLGFVRGEKPELMQVLVILSNNSIHALQEAREKKITLRAEPSNHDLVKISFRDTGYGIKKELLPIIFAPFTTTKASTEGTGMGLYNAKKIIEKHKGEIWAESEGEGKGATFFIELPIARDIKPEDFQKEDKGKKVF